MDEHRIVCDCNAKTKWDTEGFFEGDACISHPEDDEYNGVCGTCRLFHWHEGDDGKPVIIEE